MTPQRESRCLAVYQYALGQKWSLQDEVNSEIQKLLKENTQQYSTIITRDVNVAIHQAIRRPHGKIDPVSYCVLRLN